MAQQQQPQRLPAPAAELSSKEHQAPSPLMQRGNYHPQQPQQQGVIGDYIVTQQIGAGSFAVVWKGRHRVTGVEVAIKEIVTEKLNKKLQESLESEIAILKRANHPNIIRLFDIIKAPDRIFLVLEYCAGGDLSNYISRHGRVPEAVARYFMRQLGAGLQVLRANNLIHRDLKPQNLLLYTRDRQAILKIADFGFARSLQPQGLAETLCGSPLYMAPEILQFQKYDAKADLWSVGAILFELVVGRPPFGGANHVQLLHNIERTEARIPDNIAATLTEACMNMIRHLLRRNPVERLSFEEFFHHPFLDLPRRRSTSEGGAETRVDTPPPNPAAGAPPEASSGNSSSLEECLPFILDDQHQGSSDNTQAPGVRPPSAGSRPGKAGVATPAPVARAARGLWGVPVGSPGTRGAPQPKGSSSGGEKDTEPESLQEVLSRGGGGSVDSMECIERDYVVVGRSETMSPLQSLTNVSQPPPPQAPKLPTQNSPPVNLAPPRTSPASSMASRGGSGVSGRSDLSAKGVEENLAGGRGEVGSEGEDVEEPSPHPPERLASLQRCARLITELAIDKLEAAQQLESLSLQLVCLAVWREALSVCHAWAEAAEEEGEEGVETAQESGSLQGGQNSQQLLGSSGMGGPEAAAAACSVVEREFFLAVERAESLAVQVRASERADMPDAVELIFQAGLAVGRAGAVEELMGNVSNAAVAYAKAAALFYFLLVEAPSLPLPEPVVLTPGDRQRLRRYADSVNARHNQCAVKRSLQLSQQRH